MKTQWDADNLSRRMGPRGAAEWVNNKRRELETATGVKWSSFSAAGKIVFQAVLDIRVVGEGDDTGAQEKLLATLTSEDQTWLTLSEKSGLSLKETMAAGLALQRAGKAAADSDTLILESSRTQPCQYL